MADLRCGGSATRRPNVTGLPSQMLRLASLSCRSRGLALTTTGPARPLGQRPRAAGPPEPGNGEPGHQRQAGRGWNAGEDSQRVEHGRADAGIGRDVGRLGRGRREQVRRREARRVSSAPVDARRIAVHLGEKQREVRRGIDVVVDMPAGVSVRPVQRPAAGAEVIIGTARPAFGSRADPPLRDATALAAPRASRYFHGTRTPAESHREDEPARDLSRSRRAPSRRASEPVPEGPR